MVILNFEKGKKKKSLNIIIIKIIIIISVLNNEVIYRIEFNKEKELLEFLYIYIYNL